MCAPLDNNTTLEIKTLSYKIDIGAYKCIAKNAAGSSHDIGTVVVESTNVPVHFSCKYWLGQKIFYAEA